MEVIGVSTNRRWHCPFLLAGSSERKVIRCEGGELRLPDQKAWKDYADAYCSNSANGWKRCSLARAMLEHYEKEENDG